MATAIVKIELHYDLTDLYGNDEIHRDLTTEAISEDLEDRVYEDLIDLMRGDKLRFWSEIQVEENN
jgi:hypothetical protein